MAKKESKLKPPSRVQLVREFKSGKLLGTLFGKHSRGWGRDTEVVAAISDAHNAGEIDILSILTEEALAALDRNVFFQGQTLYCSLIPELSADAVELIRAVGVLIRAAGHDGAAGLPSNELAKWCEKDQERPRILLALAQSGNEDAANFLPLILRVGAKFDREYFLTNAHFIALEGDPLRRRAAIQGLGQIEIDTHNEWDRFIQTLSTVAAQGDDLSNAKVIGAVAGHLERAEEPYHTMIEEIIKSALKATAGEHSLHACADLIWRKGKYASQSLRACLLNALLGLDPKNKNTIDYLDYGLAEIFEGGSHEEVINFLEALILRQQEIKLSWFDSTCRAVQKVGSVALGDWVVRWFLKGDFELCRQITQAFFGVEHEDQLLDIDFRRFVLRDIDYPYLARKAVGFLFFQPLIAASIILSLIRSAAATTVGEVEDLLFDPLLINYASVEEKLLRNVSKDEGDLACAAAKRALVRIEKYLSDMKTAYPINELRPSERQRQIEAQRNADAMAEAYRKAENKSIFAEFVSRVIVLHGSGTISYHCIGSKTPQRIEAKMGKHSVSYEMPRIEVVDPVGLQQMLINMRAERRPM